MTPKCNQFVFGFHPQKRREVRAQFDGGAITSDGGGLLLREVEKRVGILHQFAACFADYRNPDLLEHPVEELVAQRVYGLALGYEDLNDHEELRNDPLLGNLARGLKGGRGINLKLWLKHDKRYRTRVSKCSNPVAINSGNHPCSTSRLSR